MFYNTDDNALYCANVKLCSVSYKDVDNLMRSANVTSVTSMSSVTGAEGPEKAVDGVVGPDAENCNCCSSTENSELSWWKVDMNIMYPVKQIRIFGRNDGKFNEYLHVLKLSNKSMQCIWCGNEFVKLDIVSRY